MQKHVVCDGAWLYFRIIFLVLTFLHSATGHWHAILNDQAYVLYSEHWKSEWWMLEIRKAPKFGCNFAYNLREKMSKI